MRVWVIELAVALVASAGVGGCILKAEGFTGGTPDSGAPAAADAGEDTGVTDVLEASAPPPPDATATTTPNVLPNGDFERGCEGWQAGPGVTLSESTVARTGAKGCRVCMTKGTEAYVFAEFPQMSRVGERFLAEIWTRGAEGALPTNGLQFLGGYHTTDGEEVEGAKVPGYAGAPSWYRATTILEPYKDAKTFYVVLVLDNNQGKCAIMDDAVVRLLP